MYRNASQMVSDFMLHVSVVLGFCFKGFGFGFF